MEQPRVPFELVVGIREQLARIRATATHHSEQVADARRDIRRLDDRMFQLMLLQLATIATLLASIVLSVLR